MFYYFDHVFSDYISRKSSKLKQKRSQIEHLAESYSQLRFCSLKILFAFQNNVSFSTVLVFFDNSEHYGAFRKKE